MKLFSIVKIAIGWVRVCECNGVSQNMNRHWYEWCNKLLSIVELKLSESKIVSSVEWVQIAESNESWQNMNV